MTLREMTATAPSRLDPDVARAAKAAKRAADEARQGAGTERTHDGYTLRPSIGSTGGSPNVGFELIPPKGTGPVWYLRDREAALAAVPRHLGRYAPR